MIESGLYYFWRKIVFKRSFFKKQFHFENKQNEIKPLDSRLILLAIKLYSFLIIPSIIMLILEIIITLCY